jgi:hypothetical protein
MSRPPRTCREHGMIAERLGKPELANYLRIEERELDAGGLN